ncbi:MAG: hypothetical protein NUV65_02850 [Candidatus Roizmanbacteria bacterium]|nr:hypothetical protein [Candidatus Roizmanbacteria bacterium]
MTAESCFPTPDAILAHLLRTSNEFQAIYLQYKLGLEGDILNRELELLRQRVGTNTPQKSTVNNFQGEKIVDTFTRQGDQLTAMILIMEWYMQRHGELQEIWGRASQATQWLNTALRHDLFLPTDFMHPPETAHAHCSLRGAYRTSGELGIGVLFPHALLGVQNLGNAVSIMTENISRDCGIENMGYLIQEQRDDLYPEYFLPYIQMLKLLE